VTGQKKNKEETNEDRQHVSEEMLEMKGVPCHDVMLYVTPGR